MGIPFEFPGIMWYTHLDLRLGLGIFGLAMRRKKIGPQGPKSVIGHISPSIKIAPKFERLDISGLETYQKPIANISARFERKEIYPKNHF